MLGGMKRDRPPLHITAALMAACVVSGCTALQQAQQNQKFKAFYAVLKTDAEAQGLNPAYLDDAFEGAPKPLPHVLASEGNQPEFTDTLENYLGRKLAPTRIAKAQELMVTHRAALSKAERETGIPASLIVSLWGLESNFGAAQGNVPLLPALTTLAFESPRSTFFRKELFNALKVVELSHLGPTELKGSWAGAMGQNQFMPSTFIKYARDGNANGTIDIWREEADVFASTATYLKALGYTKNQPWRVETYVAKGRANVLNELDLNPRGLSESKSRAEWEAMGLRLPPKQENAFAATTKLRYYQPHGAGGPHFLLGPNYEAILGWNKSSYFATSVLELADILNKGTR